jgi:hypothetical protein
MKWLKRLFSSNSEMSSGGSDHPANVLFEAMKGGTSARCEISVSDFATVFGAFVDKVNGGGLDMDDIMLGITGRCPKCNARASGDQIIQLNMFLMLPGSQSPSSDIARIASGRCADSSCSSKSMILEWDAIRG